MIRPVRSDGRPDAGGVFTPIYRPRVQERLETAAQLRVTLIVAPAGYGKSISLRHFLDRFDGPNVRYDVHADNAKLPGFVRGLADALSTVAPDARKTVASAHESAAKSASPARDLALWMYAHLKAFSGLIAIDDLHVTEADPGVTQFLSELVDRTKGRVRWVIASRSYLDLPVGTWMAYQDMDLAIDEADLAFTPEEAREAARSAHIGVRDEELEDLLSMTDGWPTALSFALRSSTRSLDLRNVQATTRELVYRYLAEQVYRVLSPDEREFLALAVLLPRIDIRTLQLAGYDDALGRIEELRNHGAFIVPDVEQRGTYLCHELFRDFVRHQMSLDGVEVIRRANVRAAGALEAAEDIPSALSLYAQARDSQSILRVLDLHGIALFEEARTDIVAMALDALDAKSRGSEAIPLALAGLIESAAGRYDQAISQLKRAAQRALDPERRGSILLWAARAAINSWGQSPERLLLEVADDEKVSEDTRAEARAMLSVLYARAGRNGAAEECASLAISVADRTDSPKVLARILQRTGMAASICMSYDDARLRLSRCAELCEQYKLISLAARTYGWLYVIAWNCGSSVGELQWYAQQEMAMAEQSGDMLDLQAALSHGLDVELRRGNADRIVALERRQSGIRTAGPSRLASSIEARAWVHAWAGRFDEAYRLLSASWAQFDIPLARALAAAVCALAASASGRLDRVNELVAESLKILETAENAQFPAATSITVEAPRLMCALAQAGAGRVVAAKRLLREVKVGDDIAAQGLLALVADAIPAVKAGTATCGGSGIEALGATGYMGYGKLVRSAVAALAERHSGETPSRLTPSETAILRSLAAGNSPKDIAAETGRSVYTVQAHIQNASEKLGCHGRHEVIATARRLGVVSPGMPLETL